MAYYPASLLMSDVAKTTDGILDSYSPTSVLKKLGEPVMYIIRHGEVDLDVKNLVRGLLNPELNDKGKKDAAKLPDFFKDIPLSAIVIDDSDRCKQTVLSLAGSKDITLEVDIAMRSWDAGTELEGKPIKSVEDEIEEFRNQPELVPVGGQSWGDFKSQVKDSFYRYLRRSMDGTPVALCTHGSWIQVAWSEMDDEEASDQYLDIPVEPCGVVAIYLTRDGFKPKVIAGAGTNKDE